MMNKFTKVTLLAGFILVVYGYACRAFHIYFFWESKFYGWPIIFVGLIALLFTKIKIKKAAGKKSLLEKIGVGILIFILLIQAILIGVIPSTDAYKAAKQYLLNNESLKNEVGSINSFSVIPLGSIQKSNADGKVSGSATINLIVKGEKKYKDVTVSVEKNPDTEWTVVEFQ